MDISKHKLYRTIKDYSVSKEEFTLYHDEAIDLVFTFPQPKEDQLATYYESEDYISHTDGSRSLFEKAYQFVKQIALKNKLKCINELHPAKGILLDIGAGTGDFLAVAKQNGWQTIGIEPNDKAKKIAQNKGVELIQATNLLDDHSIDVITMWHVLEHVPNVENQIKELKRLLKPNGSIIIAVPNFNSYDAKYYDSYWAAFDVPRHLWHFSKKAIKSLFERENFHLEKTIPMLFDAFYVALLSEKYKTGKMNFIKATFIGIKSNLKANANGEYSSLIYILKNNQVN
jgi:2-polyprenyl-3-methyl-5-hydroxy-6-metoxy-1,4-benzoquinol methylase